MTDDAGYADIGGDGAPDIRTRNIDFLTRDGVRLTDFARRQGIVQQLQQLLTECRGSASDSCSVTAQRVYLSQR